jgi:transposase
MKEILKMKQNGMSLKQIQEKIDPKISLSALSKRLRKFAKENGLKYSKNQVGRKKLNLKIK